MARYNVGDCVEYFEGQKGIILEANRLPETIRYSLKILNENALIQIVPCLYVKRNLGQVARIEYRIQYGRLGC